MADPRLDGRRADTRSERRSARARSRVALALVAGLVVAVGLAGCGGLTSDRATPGTASAAPSAAGSATTPVETATSPVESATPAAASPTEQSASSSAVASSPVASLPVSSARIAVVDAAGGLATADERGGSRVAYPAPGVVFGFPAWSPDGSRLAAVGQSPDDVGVYVFAVDRATGASAAPTVVYRSPDRPPFYLYWTPDGRHVSFLTTESVGLALRVAPIDSGTPLDGNDAASVIRRGSPLYFQWVEEDRLLVHIGGGTDAFTGQVGLDGAIVGSPLVADGSFRPASLSRDGRFVAYARSLPDATGEIVVEAPDGSGTKRLPVFGPAALQFDPNGDTLATIAPDKPVSGGLPLPVGPLRLLDPGSGATRTVLDGSVVAFFWAPDGRTIAAIRLVAPGPGPVAVVGRTVLAGPGRPGPVVSGGGASEGTSLRLAFVDVPTGALRSERVVRVADQFVAQILPYFEQYALSHRMWSPDNSSVLLPIASPTGPDQLMVVPADGTDPRPVAEGTKGSWSP